MEDQCDDDDDEYDESVHHMFVSNREQASPRLGQ